MSHRVRGGTRVATWLLAIGLTVGLAAVWAAVTLRQLSATIVHEGAEHLEHARITFESIRIRTVENLRGHARVMVEDPRLKSTLATEGVDEVTVADILGDLAKLRRTGFLMVLSPDGRVFAQTGADELRGLDLSGSSPVRKAQSSLDAEVGSWVLGGKLMDLAITPVRFGAAPIAYLVVGQAVGQDVLKAVADQTGVAVASATGDAILAASSDEVPKAVFVSVAAQPGSFPGRLLELGDRSYVTAISELHDTGQSRPRLILVQPLARLEARFGAVKWLFFIPPLLVLVAVVFALTTNRRTLVVRHA